MAAVLDQAESLLACLRCREAPLGWTDSAVTCSACGWQAARSGHVVSATGETHAASFDTKFDVLDAHNNHPVTWELCFRRQRDRILNVLESSAADEAKVLLDIGCGPKAQYEKPPGWFTIGVEPSLPSLQANDSVDLGLHLGAERLPLRDNCVDAVVAIYALHHMIGSSVSESWNNVRAAMTEAARVTQPGGTVIVAEVCPWRAVWPLEFVGWRMAKRLLPNTIDFLFWPVARLRRLGAAVFPGADLQADRFTVGGFEKFPPMIDQDLQVPRVLYPLSVRLFRWTLAS